MRCKTMIKSIFGGKFVATLVPPNKEVGKWHFALAPMGSELSYSIRQPIENHCQKRQGTISKGTLPVNATGKIFFDIYWTRRLVLVCGETSDKAAVQRKGLVQIFEETQP